MNQLILGIQELLIECEMPLKRKPGFRIRYAAASGHPPDEAYMQTQENKRGIEYRMYFNASAAAIQAFRNAGFRVSTSKRGYREQYRCRINDEELFWILIGNGKVLGVN